MSKEPKEESDEAAGAEEEELAGFEEVDERLADQLEEEPHPAAGPTAEAEVPNRLPSIIESVIFAAGSPVPVRRLSEILKGPSPKEIKEAIESLVAHYNTGERGIQLVRVAGGYQFRTVPQNAEWVRAMLRERPARLGRAALETLAVIAYKQPVTRAEIEAIRGVDADSALGTLLAKKLIRIAGRKEAVGRPLMYATTLEFLEVFGLGDLSELPALKEIGPAPENEDEALAAELEEGLGIGEVAEDSEPGGGELAPSGGGADPAGAGEGEREDGDGAGDEGGPE